ncbi:MAG TPA: prephenate dehydrogenase/arogenate dehydrogenase family protein [Vicinamibacterales bacterium]
MSDPPFHRIAIVGLGLIGGSIAFAARKAWPSVHVVGIDRQAILDEAIARRAIHDAGKEPAAVAGADLVVLAAPVLQNLALLKEVVPHAAGAVVTDVGSTKRGIVSAAESIGDAVTFVGGHPLGGGARGGFEFATAAIFTRRPWILTPNRSTPANATSRLFAFTRGLGAVPSTMTAADHDRLLAFLSHLPQLTVSALMQVVGAAATEKGLTLAGQGLVDSTRLASSPASVWRDVCATNADAIAAALDQLIERLTELRANLEQGDAIERTFDEAGRWRGELMRTRE